MILENALYRVSMGYFQGIFNIASTAKVNLEHFIFAVGKNNKDRKE